MQETLNGSSRQARDFRDVFECKVLFISQSDHFGVLRAQVVNSLLQDLRQLPPFRDAVWRVLIASLSEAVLRRLREGRRPDIGPPYLIDRRMVGNREEPARKFSFRRISVEFYKRFDKGVLRQFLRARRIANHPKYHGKDRPFVSLHELLKSAIRAA